MTRRAPVLLLAVTAVVLACVESLTDIGPAAVAGLVPETDSLDLRVDRTVRLRVFPVDETGAFRPDVDVTWSSDAPDIVAVNDSGVATGVAIGVATVTAAVAGFQAPMRVRVEPPPRLGVTGDSVGFTARAGDPDPGPDSVEVVNAGGFVLAGLTVDTIVYGAGAADWLMAQLDSTAAPATLTLTAMSAGVTTAGVYAADVRVAAVDAEGGPVTVTATLTITAGDPAAAAIAGGDGQTAAVNTTVATAPAVLVADAFGNPVPGAGVTFMVTAGGGAVTGGAAVTDAAGVARAGSWRLGTTAGANALRATVDGAPAVPAVTFGATGAAAAASQIAAGAGDNQSAVAGSDVPTPPAVVVRDQFGNGVAGVTVTFAVASGGGIITGATPVSDAGGMAAVGSWTLGTDAGPNTLTAAVSGLAGSPVTFMATGLSGNATNLVPEAGNLQTDTVAATLATPYAVKVTDVNGNGVAGVPVAWSIPAGQGAITMSSTTDADGIATATRVLGTMAGTQTAQAAVGGLIGSPVAFSATALPGAAVSVEPSAGTGQMATVNTAVAVDPAVTVRDQFMNPVPGHAVTFAVTAGGGSVDPVTAVTTDAAGVAAATSWTLGTTAGTGNNTLEAAAAGGLTGSPVVFTASATAAAPANIAIVVGSDNQSAVSGVAVPTDPAVTVTDQFGNPVGGVTVTFQVTGGGGAVTGAAPVTNASGVAAVGSWTVRAAAPGDAQGRTENTLRASINAGAVFADVTAFGIFSYATHVYAKWSQGCTGCHGGAVVSGLSLLPDAATSYTALTGSTLVCDSDGTLVPQGYRRISTAGGATGEALSVALLMIDPPAPLPGNCNLYMPDASSSTASVGMSQGVRDTLRAWIRNGAPNN